MPDFIVRFYNGESKEKREM